MADSPHLQHLLREQLRLTLPQNALATEVKSRAIAAVKWAGLAEIVTRAASPLTVVLLARILTPDDFGIVAVGMALTSFAQIFNDAGLAKALVQTEEDVHDVATVVFWTNLGLGAFIYLVLYALAPTAASFFRTPGSVAILRALSIQVILNGLFVVQQGLCLRELNLAKLFWVRLLASILPAVISIPLAILGWGPWALVAGALAAQIAATGLLWILIPWKPSARYDFALARRLAGFGRWVLLEAIVNWFITWGAGVVVARYFGISDLGLYRIGSAMVSGAFALLLAAFYPVAYASLSRLQHDRGALVRAFRQATKLAVVFALPMGACFLVIGTDAARAIFPPRWSGVGVTISLLGLRAGLSWIVGLNGEAYRAAGRPDVAAKTLVIWAACLPFVYYFAAIDGLVVFLYAYLASVLVEIGVHVWVAARLFSMKLSDTLLDNLPSLGAAATMAVLMRATLGLIENAGGGAVLSLIVTLSVGVVAYVAILWRLDQQFIRRSAALLLQALTGATRRFPGLT